VAVSGAREGFFLKTKLLGLFASLALLGSPVAANASSYVVTLEEVGSDVVATGSGDIDLTGLLYAPLIGGTTGVIYPSMTSLLTGTGSLSFYTGTTTFPVSFGSGIFLAASSSVGGGVGFDSSFLAVPEGYTSETLVSDSSTYDTATFLSLGVTPGTYIWTWGAGADQSFTLDIVAPTPLPAALPLFATGLGTLGLFGWRRKRKAAVLAA
jgi:hypothetical protein